MAQIQSPAWKLPYALSADKEKKIGLRKTERKKRKYPNFKPKELWRKKLRQQEEKLVGENNEMNLDMNILIVEKTLSYIYLIS